MSRDATVRPILHAGDDMPAGCIYGFVHGSAGVYSAPPMDSEKGNQDAAALIPYDDDSGVLVVADGLGGMRAGATASQTALDVLQASLKEGAREGQMLQTAIMNGIERSNQAIVDLGIGAATTLALVEVGEGYIRPYHVGDSAIIASGQRGRIKLQTMSHSPVGFAIEAGMLDADEAMHHADRHIVSNVLGTPEMRIEVGPRLKLARFDTVLVASDGLSDNLTVEEIVERLRKGPIADAVDVLASEARRRMQEPLPGRPSKPDDLTLIVFRPTAHRRRVRKTDRV